MVHSVLQKVLIIGGINIISVSNGYVLGQIAGMTSALKKGIDGIHLRDSEINFLASSIFPLLILGFALVAFVSDRIGRKCSFIVFSAMMTSNWIVLYYARSMQMFMLSRIISGVSYGALLALKLCTTSEYSTSNTRAVFLNIISTFAPSFGTGIAHALGALMHWTSVALIGIIPSIIGAILPFFWVESPHWLAMKGRFEECEIAFRKIHGNDSGKELNLLIRMEKVKLATAEENQSVQTYKKLLLAVKKRYFWDLMLLSVFIYAFLTASGKIIFSLLAIDIIEEMTGSSDVIWFTLVVDGFIIVGSILSCILITRLSMRTLLFTTGFVSICILVTLSACAYCKKESVTFQWLNVTLLAIFFCVFKTGPYPVLETLMGEIYPLEIKIYCFFMSGVIWCGSLWLNVILLPYMSISLGYSGLFLLNAGIMSLCLCYIWMRLPETKGRSLQEIEIYFKTKTYENIDQALSGEQLKALL